MTLTGVLPMLAWILLVLSPTQTKLAGLLWVILCFWAVALALRHPPQASTPTRLAALRWLAACCITLGTWFVMSVYWNEPCCTLSADVGSGLRLWLGALAAYLWARHWAPLPEWKNRINHGLALACISSLLIAIVMDRGNLPSYPIPWSAAVAMVLCLLLPQALDAPHGAWQRRGWLLCCGLGLAAVFLSQSRGSYLAIGWLIYVWGSSSQSWNTRITPVRIAAGCALVTIVMALTSALPSDPLRIREGWNDWNASRHEESMNTSLGARLALYELALKTIGESPWVGVGARERLHRIHTLGQDLPPQEARKLAHAREQGHVHNAYLHSAMDGGMISLAGFLMSIGGLLYAAQAWKKTNPLARRQMLGVAFVHASASLSNVNLAHNYYAVMLSLCVTLIVIQSQSQGLSDCTVSLRESAQ